MTMFLAKVTGIVIGAVIGAPLGMIAGLEIIRSMIQST